MRGVLRVLLLLGVTLGAHSAPASLESLLPAGTRARIAADGSIRRTFRGRDALELFPDLPLRSSEQARVGELEPTVGVEFLSIYRPPVAVQELRIHNAVYRLSTLKGIRYFSVSRNEEHELFTEAHLVADAHTLSPLPDPFFAELPAPGAVDRRLALLEDASMGRYVASVVYESGAGSLTMHVTNQTGIRRLLVPFVRPGGLLSLLVLVPLDDAILFYGYSCVKTVSLFGLAERRGESSMTNRLAALYQWFTATYESAGW